MSEEETYSLYDGHHTERNAYGCYTLGVDATYEVGVCQIVHTGRQHTDDGGRCHSENHLMYWGMGKECVII